MLLAEQGQIDKSVILQFLNDKKKKTISKECLEI